MDWATKRRSWPMCRDTHSPSPPCSPPVVCAISQAASTRSGRRHCSLPPTPHAPSSRGATGRPTRSCTGGRDRTGAACCTGGPGNTPTARASDSTWIRPRWADASPTGCSPIRCSCPPPIPTMWRCSAAPRATTPSWTSAWLRTSRSSPVASPIPVSWRRDRRTSSARWSGAGARSCRFGVATPGAIARTVRRPPRRSSGATAPRSSRPGPRSCSRCGTRRPSRRVAARPNASSNGPRRAGECGGICCCSASTPGNRRPADRTPTARTPSRSGSTSGGSWTARRSRPTPRSRPRCCGSASALAGAGARAASYSTLRAGRGATWCECRTARRLVHEGREWPTVDLPDGSALVVARDVPALGYLALTESERAANPPRDEGATLEAQAGGFHVVLDPASGAIRSLTTGDGAERVRQAQWSGLNQLVYVQGGAHSALWTGRARDELRTAPDLTVSQAELVSARRERLPGIGARLMVERKLEGCTSVATVVTLYDELPWMDIANRITKPATLDKEALYVAFPFALTKPTVEVEVPLGRMTVERDQQPGSCRDWYCHAHWVWLHDAAGGMLWSGPDTPLFTLNDIFRGQWRRKMEPDGTLFAYVLHNYWPTNFAPSQGGDLSFRHRLSVLPRGGERAETVRRGWAACDPLYVSAPYASVGSGALPRKDSGLFIADPGVAVVGVKPADDRTGAVVKLVDLTGVARAVAVWPGAYGFRGARRANFVEMNGDRVPVAPDGHVTIDLPAWGAAALRLFTPREGAD